MLIVAIIVFGVLVGALAQLILGRQRGGIDWAKACVAGLLGSFVGGLVISVLSGDGLDLAPSGLIGSVAGAVLVTAGLSWWDRRDEPSPEEKAADLSARRSGDPRKRAARSEDPRRPGAR